MGAWVGQWVDGWVGMGGWVGGSFVTWVPVSVFVPVGCGPVLFLVLRQFVFLRYTGPRLYRPTLTYFGSSTIINSSIIMQGRNVILRFATMLRDKS